MGADLAMNPAAVLTDLRHPNTQRLTDGAATLARTNQSDQGNFPRREPYISARKHTRQPGGHADAPLSVNRESCNLSPSRTDLPSHLRRAVCSVQSSTRGCSSGRPFRRSQRFRRLHCKTCGQTSTYTFQSDKCSRRVPSLTWFGDVFLRLGRAVNPQPSSLGQIHQRAFDARVGE